MSLSFPLYSMENGFHDDGQPSTSQDSQSTSRMVSRSQISLSQSEIKRRKTTYEFQTRMRDEQRRADQGLLSEERIDEIYIQVKEQGEDLGEVESLRTIKADAQVLQQLIQLSTTELDKLRGETAKSMDPDLFITRIEKFALNQFPQRYRSEHSFISLGRRSFSLLHEIPDFHFLRPCIELKNSPQLPGKREIKKVPYTRPVKREIKSKTLHQLQKETADTEFSVSKELDNVSRQLRAFYKSQRSDELDYYKFVLNPKSFGETVENMFYISFLVKDGRIGLKMDKTTGCPKIVKASHKDKTATMQRSQLETVQVLGNLDYSTWRSLVKKLQIKEAYIKRIANNNVQEEQLD
ncbi:hypothetical protein ACQ4LE_002799 [Meloidogyne hapla]